MKKKLVMLGAGLTIGSALVITSAFADIGGAQGYDTYKTAIKTTAAASNVTRNVKITLKDNGKPLLNINSMIKTGAGMEDGSAKVAIQSGGTAESIDFYSQSGKHIIKSSSSDIYNVIENQHGDSGKWGGREHSGPDASMQKELENVVDALVGNLKNDVTVSGIEGGSKQVNVELSGTQIPSAANAIGSFAIKQILNGEHNPVKADDTFGLGKDLEQVTAQFPKLTQAVTIAKVDLRAEVNADDYITNQQADITITGQDANGEAHEVVLSADIDMTDFNTTTPDTVDLTGKTVHTIDKQDWEGMDRK